MKSFGDYITEASMTNLEAERAIKNLKPFTICDILSDSTPDRLYQLMDEDLWFQTLKAQVFKGKRFESYEYDEPAWFNRLDKYKEAFADWFEAEGGSKQNIIPKILEMASCKNRGKWANWSGKAWRGMGRSLQRVAKYDITEKTTSIGGKTWIVAEVGYKSRYEVQSWTNSFITAKNFADGGLSDISVVLEMSIGKGEGFLSPEVSNRMAKHYKESEVLRIGNKPTKVKAYIEIRGLVDELADIVANTRIPSGWNDMSSKDKKEKWMEIVSQKLNRLGFSKASIANMTKPNHPFAKKIMLEMWR